MKKFLVPTVNINQG